MSNAELIAEARAFRPGGGDYLDVRLADALEATDEDHYNSEKALIDTVNRLSDRIKYLRATVDWLLQDQPDLRSEIHRRADSGYNA